MSEGELRIMFLDVDGVLTSERTAIVHGGPQELGGPVVGRGFPNTLKLQDLLKFDSVALGLIRTVCFETGCKVVLSSTWRKHGDTPEEFSKAFKLPVIGFTPVLGGKRGREIERWLNDHPEVKDYAIIDDDSDMLPTQSDHFVHVSSTNGVLSEHYHLLVRILRGQLGGGHSATLTWEWEDEDICEPS